MSKQSSSPAGSLDGANWKKIGKGILINLAGALVTYLAVVVIPDLKEAVTACQTAESCNLNPNLIWLVPIGASVVNILKEWLTDYSK